MTVIWGAPRLVVGAPSDSGGRQECPPRVWYSPEIDTSKFTLHILSDTPGGFQWLKYILRMLCNATRRLGNGKRVILLQRVPGSVRAVRAVRNTRVFLTETRVVADGLKLKTTKSWREMQMIGNCTEWLRSTTCSRCGRAAKPSVVPRRNHTLKTNR